MFGQLGAMEIGIVVVVLLVIFGPSQIPKIGRSLGQGIREFRQVGKELTGDGEGWDNRQGDRQ